MVVIRRPGDGALLVSVDADAAGEPYERPLGGHAELGELAVDTARREVREEIGQDLCDLCLLTVLENVFELDGVSSHDIVFVFDARFANESAYDLDEHPRLDDPSGRLRVRWRPARATSPRLVPPGVNQLINP
jgi:ADP-ribose pyrophosphatase YjhB (NUDIX family)